MLDPRSSLRNKEFLFAEAQKRGAADSTSFLQHSHSPFQKFSTLASFFLNFVTNTRLPLTLLEENALNSSQSTSSSSASSSSSLQLSSSSSYFSSSPSSLHFSSSSFSSFSSPLHLSSSSFSFFLRLCIYLPLLFLLLLFVSSSRRRRRRCLHLLLRRLRMIVAHYMVSADSSHSHHL